MCIGAEDSDRASSRGILCQTHHIKAVIWTPKATVKPQAMSRNFLLLTLLLAMGSSTYADFLLYTPDKLLESLQVRSAILQDQILRMQTEPATPENQEVLNDLVRRVGELQVQIAALNKFVTNDGNAVGELSVARTAAANSINAQQNLTAQVAGVSAVQPMTASNVGFSTESLATEQWPRVDTTTAADKEDDFGIEELLEALIKQRELLDDLIKKVQAQILRDLAS